MTEPKNEQVFEIELPDGQVLEVTAPVGVSRQDLAAATKKYWAKQQGNSGAEQTLGPQQELAIARAEQRRRALQRAKAEQQRRAQAKEVGHPIYRQITTPAASKAASDVGAAGGISGAVLDGGLMGFGDEYLAGLSSVLGVQPDGQGGADWFDYSKPIGERYGTALDAIRSEQADFAEANPGKALSGEMAGAILGPGKGMGQFINTGKTTAARMGRGGLAGGGSAGAYGFGEGEGDVSERGLSGALNAPVGLAGGAGLVAVGQGFNRALASLQKRPELREALPTLAGLKEKATGLYQRAKELGGELPASDMKKLADDAADKVKSEGYDAQLHPRVAAVLDRLESEGGPKSLEDMDILRRVAKNAAASMQSDERRIAYSVIDAIDDAVEGMGAGSPVLKEARDVWGRVRRMEIIETAIEKASLNDDFAAGLRSQFKSLLRNPKKLRGFSEADKRVIRQVAKGTPAVKSLRALSLLSPTRLPGMALAGGTAFAGPGAVPAMALAGTGVASRAIADALTRRGANKALSTVGMSAQQRGLMSLLPPIALARGVAVPGMAGLGGLTQ